jgi:hypothetical protein
MFQALCDHHATAPWSGPAHLSIGQGRLVIGVVGILLTCAGIGVALLLLRQGIDYADKMSSVISMVSCCRWCSEP